MGDVDFVGVELFGLAVDDVVCVLCYGGFVVVEFCYVLVECEGCDVVVEVVVCFELVYWFVEVGVFGVGDVGFVDDGLF